MSFIIHFSNKNDFDIHNIGNKAKTLIETSHLSLPVPQGFVLTTHFFEPWWDKIKILDEWHKLLEHPSIELATNIKAKILTFHFSGIQKNSLEIGLKSVDVSRLLSVRSSAIDEDLSHFSYAGLYATYLGISCDALETYIAKVFSSMFDERVVDYKINKNLSFEDSRIAIIIQEQIHSDVSGVTFSINPNNNCFDELVINANFGLGETIVSGQVTPDTYILEKHTGQILSYTLSDKTIASYISKEGGTVNTNLINSRADTLSHDHLKEIVSLAIQLEKHYGKPVDLEWAFENESLYLLQVRPITTYIPLFPELVTQPGQRKKLYLDHNMVSQGLTQPLSVSTADIWAEIVEKLEFDIFPKGDGGFMINLHGRQYIDVSNMLKGMGKKYTLSVIKEYSESVMTALKSVDLNDYKSEVKPKLAKRSKLGVLRTALTVLPLLVKSRTNLDGLVKECYQIENEVYDYFKKPLDEGQALDMQIKTAIDVLYKSVIHQGVLIVGMLSLMKLEKLFSSSQLKSEISSLGMDLEANRTKKMSKMMFDLASSNTFLAIKSKEDFVNHALEGSFPQVFQTEYDKYMTLYGNRCYKELDLASERMSEQPGNFYDQLISINITDNQNIHINKKQETAYKRLLEVATQHKFEKAFIKHAHIYQSLFGFRESPKFLLTHFIGQFRLLLLGISDDFVHNKRLDNRSQIFDLHIHQIMQAQSHADLNLRVLIEENLKPYKKVAHVRYWPVLIDSRGKIIREVRSSTSSDLVGEAISPGLVTGRARVLHSPHEKKVEPGDILVTRSSEPSWIPVFSNASGVVLEVGGSLQHGAIIAREYGLPCVIGIHDIYTRIHDGDLIKVDGNSGIVRILNRKDH
ncbi:MULTISPECIES: PEP/pyruvate-binding domain-containing protein [unclassified Fusibacter]|uniref:PEP/pyruvate-binding domain-containing protein n=1 Tax=unclassified Fusibacter TaxID=2624464 RepID=UPI0010111AF4|nr:MULTISPECIES: PEP/pyruvate-binding domain-containing protein [unclassified Fusibacter]MCK8061666.1 PEP-utilizing enzyme [Fusibacter sp. A2]NPE23850.1 hypothetical protein [Fusibacter sp. A1]RXV58565.1 hypothetical protein DWB64_18865 [Fusibacter sp. A1]